MNTENPVIRTYSVAEIKRRAWLYTLFSFIFVLSLIFTSILIPTSFLKIWEAISVISATCWLGWILLFTFPPFAMLGFKRLETNQVLLNGDLVEKEFLESVFITKETYNKIKNDLYSTNSFQVGQRMRFSPITENPKVVDFSYEIVVNASGTLSKFLLWRELLKHYGSVPKFLKYHMFELNSHHSKDLAKFTNPLDAKQQENFRGMIEVYFGPLLKKFGLTLKGAVFDIAQ